ncbi:Uncharacterised protein [Elizabethkingia miricola]|nr:Uncharacterised protein [Elizabethkingia miricola]
MLAKNKLKFLNNLIVKIMLKLAFLQINLLIFFLRFRLPVITDRFLQLLLNTLL